MKKLEIKNLIKNYGKHNVLNNLSFDVYPKDIVALVGVNGSGKSTLIECICGIKKINAGSISFDEININEKKDLIRIKKSIGYLPQNFSLFSDLTVKENLTYLSSIYELDTKRIDEIIDLCYLRDKQNVLAKHLSGGFKQLLSLSGAILHNPSLLILDEPTSAMDPLFRKQFWNIIHACNKAGATILVTTHYMEEIFECTKLLCLAKGKIVHETKVKEMFEKGKFTSIDEVLNYYILKEQHE